MKRVAVHTSVVSNDNSNDVSDNAAPRPFSLPTHKPEIKQQKGPFAFYKLQKLIIFAIIFLFVTWISVATVFLRNNIRLTNLVVHGQIQNIYKDTVANTQNNTVDINTDGSVDSPRLLRLKKALSTLSLQTTQINETENISENSIDDSFGNKNIPQVLIFTHYLNLLDIDNNTIIEGDKVRVREIKALSNNVKHVIKVHPEATIRFLTDKDCLNSIRHVLGSDTPLIEYFVNEKEGMFKSDICRGAALFETGGIYLDVDVGLVHSDQSLWKFLYRETNFATVLVHRESRYPGAFFQAFLATSPEHPIIKRYLELFIQYYQGKVTNITSGPLGVQILRLAYNDFENLHNTVELWQEVKYTDAVALQWVTPDRVPPPTWGTHRACQFIVVSRIESTPVSSLSSKSKLTAIVPLYSRIGDSRMCPLNAKKRKKK